MPRRHQHRKDLGSLFASSLIIVLGAGMCLTLYGVGASDASLLTVITILAVAGLGLALLIGVRLPSLSAGLDFWHTVYRARADQDRPVDYVPQRIDRPNPGKPGQQTPVTAQELRDIRELSSNTWVPSRARLRSRKDQDDDNGVLDSDPA